MLTAFSAKLQTVFSQLHIYIYGRNDYASRDRNVAPNFALMSSDNERVTLSQYRGDKHLVLSFHVFDFTGG